MFIYLASVGIGIAFLAFGALGVFSRNEITTANAPRLDHKQGSQINRGSPILKGLEVEIAQSPRWDINLIATINNDGDIPLRNISGEPSVKVVFSKIREVPGIGDSRNVGFDDESLARVLPDIPSKSTEDLIFRGRDGIITASADFFEEVPLPNELFATLDLNMSDDFGGTYTFSAKGYLNMRGANKFVGSFPLEIIERSEVTYKGPER